MRFINELKNQNWLDVLNEIGSQTAYSKVHEIIFSNFCACSTYRKLAKNIIEINRGCQLHSRNQSNEKNSYMLLVKNVGILSENATFRNIGTD